MYPLEDARLHHTAKLCRIGHGENIQVFRTDYYIDRSIFAKTLIHTLKLPSAETYQTIAHHRTVQDIAFTDKIGNERIDRLIVDIGRRTDLLNLSFAHDHNGIAQRQSLLLIVRNINKGDAQTAVHFLQFHLHILTHFQIECCQRFVEQQHFRLVYNGTGDGHTLLLSTRQRVYVTVFIVGHAHHLQCHLYLLLHLCLRHFLQFQSESNVIIYIQVREQRIFLKHRIHRTTMRRSLGNFCPIDIQLPFRGSLESRNESQQRCLSTSRRTENRHEFPLTDRQVNMVECRLFAKEFRHVFYFDNRFIVLLHKHVLISARKGTHYY